MRELDDLGERFWAWRACQQPRTRDDIPRLDRPPGWLPEVDAGLADRRREELGVFEAELARIDPDEVPDRVDHRLLSSAMARVRWESDILRVRGIPRFWTDQALGPVYDALLRPAVDAVRVGGGPDDWCLREGAGVPLTVEEIAGTGRREYERAVWLELLHATRNRNVPVRPLPADADQQVRAQARDEAAVRQFYVRRGLLSQPESLRHYLTL